jgi:hypothetical protein
MNDETPFEVVLDIAARRFHATLRGTWSTPTLVEFQNAMRDVIARCELTHTPPESLLALIDMRDYGVQSQEVASTMQAGVEHYQRLSRHIAVVVSGSALQRMQVRRVAPHSKHRFFTDYRCAVEWLDHCAEALKRERAMSAAA